MANLDDLPEDMICLILKSASLQDIANFLLLSRKSSRHTNSTNLWRILLLRDFVDKSAKKESSWKKLLRTENTAKIENYKNEYKEYAFLDRLFTSSWKRPKIVDAHTVEYIYDFSEINLTTIPSKLHMVDIADVCLSYNKINTIPANLLEMIQLKYLNLCVNKIKEIPANISNLVCLEQLFLTNNSIDKIPVELCYLNSLKVLRLGKNSIKEVPKEIGNLTRLQVLDLSQNKLQSIPKEIGNLINLQELILAYNKISKIPEEMGNLTYMSNLDLSNNNLTELPDIFKNLIDIGTLNLSFNSLSDVDNLQYISKLSAINLSNNKLTSIPKEIINYKLNVDNNPLSLFTDFRVKSIKRVYM